MKIGRIASKFPEVKIQYHDYVCTQKLSDWQGQNRTAITQGLPRATQPGCASFSGLDSARDNPLSTGELETLRNDLFTAALNSTATNHITGGPELMIAHAFDMRV
jgi:hypothetical protein